MTTPLTKADRLAIGAAVAPTVRRAADAPRKVTVVDRDGRPVRETTHVEVAKAVLARSDIEFSVQEGKRPPWVKCKTCGAPVAVKPIGAIPVYCRKGTHTCNCGRPIMAEGCGLGKSCARCTGAKALQAISPAERAERNAEVQRARWAAMTPDQKAAAARALRGNLPDELRREMSAAAGRKAMESMSPEQRSELARKGNAVRWAR